MRFAYRPFVSIQSGADDWIVGSGNRWVVSYFRFSVLINYFIIRYSDKVPVKPVFPLVGLGSLLFGVFLGFFPGLFITYLMYIFGFLMVVAGVNQLWNMFRLRRLIPFRWYVLFFILLITGLGVFVLFNPLESASVPFILLGISFMLYGVSELVNGVRWRKYSRMQQQKASETIELIE